MVDSQESKPKKGAITEEDVCTLLQRYSAVTVLSLLKEVSQYVNVKIDWKGLVEKTETGIKSAREYQMLWRHLAYRQPLIHNIASDDQPLDDDSDLEYELEAYPLVGTEDVTEASNCVKALTSGPPNKSRVLNSSTCVLSRMTSEHQQVQKRAQAIGTFGQTLGGNGSTSDNHKKRKSNSDLELVAKGESNGERDATQRAQKGNNTKKKQGSSSIGKLSQVQIDTRRALDMAFKDNPSAGCGTVKVNNIPKHSSSKLSLEKKAPPQSSISPGPIEAAAVAAGARIGSPSDKATLLKAAQSKNAVHIRGGIPVPKTYTTSISSALPPNVHLICTGPSTKPTSSTLPPPPPSKLPKVEPTSTDRVTDV